MELYLVRHIEPYAVKGICYGQTDVQLPSDYLDLHENIRRQLPENYDQVYASPLSRCKILADALSSKAIVDKRLMELNFGEWEGQKWDAIDREVLDNWAKDYVNQSPPGGESLQGMANRFSAFIEDLSSGKTVVVIAHAGIIRCAMHLFSGVPLNQVMQQQVAYGSIHKFKLKRN